MANLIMEFEGTWEEIERHASEFKGRRVRLTVLAEESPMNEERASVRPRSGRSLLQHAGTWVGEDIEACLQEVYNNRLKSEFE
jgi:hypothetical protein